MGGARPEFSGQEYFAKAKAQFDENGSDRHWTRKNLLLPYSWRQLSPGDIAEIQAALREPLSAEATIEEHETRLAVAAILTTGRRLGEIVSLRIFDSEASLARHSTKVGLFRFRKSLVWKLPPGKPVWKEKKTVARPIGASKASSDDAARAISKKRRKRPKKRPLRRWVRTEVSEIALEQFSAEQLLGSPDGIPLFTLSRSRLEKLIVQFLRNRRGVDSDEPRWAARTVESLERYLLTALTHEAGGDPVYAARLTNRTTEINRSAASYGVHWVSRHRRKGSARTAVGSQFYVDTPILVDFVRALQARLTATPDPQSSFEALADYTAAMVIFGLGHRANFDHLPATSAIDEVTGFCVLNDKGHDNPAKARLVWVADELREQIRRYESALRDALEGVPSGTKSLVLQRLNAGELTFIDLSKQGRVMSLSEIWKRAVGIDPAFEKIPHNVGRHWLRTHLSGRCSTETLHAFFGHSELGTGPWILSSCLDPLKYRGDLLRILPSLLKDLGWVAQGQATPAAKASPFQRAPTIASEISPPASAPGKKCKRAFRSPFHDVVLGHETAIPEGLSELRFAFKWEENQDDQFQLGQILASAIVNGALLDRTFWNSWINSWRSASHWDERRWVTMEHYVPEIRRRITKRWFADPVTCKLLDGWHAKRAKSLDERKKQIDPEAALALFLDRRCKKVSIDAFHSWATWRWRLRLPPLLLAHALGETPSVTMSETSWCALVTKEVGKRWRFRTSRSRYYGAKKQLDIWIAQFRETYRDEARIFSFTYNLKKYGGITDAMEKRLCAEAFAKRAHQSQGQKVLGAWCVRRLTEERSGNFSKGYAPSTVRARLATILTVIFPESAAENDFVIDKAKLVDATRSALAKFADDQTRVTIRKASRDLLRYLEETPLDQGYSGCSETVIESLALDDDQSSNFPDAVSANLISDEKFHEVLESLGESHWARELQLVAILGFRAGLRLPEVLNLRLSDFVCQGEIFELQIEHTPQRRLKTFSSRRILPLHVLLTTEEQVALKDWLGTRRHLPCHPDVAPRAFGAPYSRARTPQYKYEEALGQAFRNCDVRGANFAHLRHSFASYLLLHLMLPDEESATTLLRVFKSNLSWSRAQILRDVFLGKERIGQASLHAVSQALGHTGINITLRAYQHLLDVVLDLYVSRKATFDELTCSAWDYNLEAARDTTSTSHQNDGLESGYKVPDPEDCCLSPVPLKWQYRKRSNPGAGREYRAKERRRLVSMRLKTPSKRLKQSKHDWSVIWSVTTRADDQSSSLRAAAGLTKREAEAWKKRIQAILPGFILMKKSDGSFTIPLGAGPQYELNRLWSYPFEGEIDAETRQALSHFLGNYDVKNGFGRVESIEEALTLRRFLVECGVRWDNILINSVSDYHDVPVKKTKRLPWHASRIDPGFKGYPTVSLRAGEREPHAFGKTVDITRRFRPKKWVGLKPQTRGKEGDRWMEFAPVHRHAIYAVKFFLVLLCVAEKISPKRLPHANKRLSWMEGSTPKERGTYNDRTTRYESAFSPGRYHWRRYLHKRRTLPASNDNI